MAKAKEVEGDDDAEAGAAPSPPTFKAQFPFTFTFTWRPPAGHSLTQNRCKLIVFSRTVPLILRMSLSIHLLYSQNLIPLHLRHASKSCPPDRMVSPVPRPQDDITHHQR